MSAEGEHEIGTEEEGGTQEEDIVVWKGPVTPRPWESFGSELEVQELNVVEARERVLIYFFFYLFSSNGKILTFLS